MRNPLRHTGKGFASLPALAALLAAALLLAACDPEEWSSRVDRRDAYGRSLPKLPPKIVAPVLRPHIGPMPESEIGEKTIQFEGHINNITFHPDGKSVLFDLCQHVSDCYLLSYDLTNKLTKTIFRKRGVSAEEAQYSPDGNWIAFQASTSLPNGQSINQIGIVDKYGTGFRSLAVQRRNFIWRPNFSPDGKFVIYAEMGFAPPSDIYRVNFESGKVEALLHLEDDSPSLPAFFGSAEEIIFVVRDGIGNKNRQEAPCRDSRPAPVSNPGNARLCKLNLVTGASNTLYNEKDVSRIFPSFGRSKVLFKPRPKDGWLEERSQIILLDGESATLVMTGGLVRPNGTKDRIPSSASLSPAGDKVACTDYYPTIKQRIQNFEATGPRFSVRDLKTGNVEEFLVPIPDEEFAVYRDYVKPKLDRKSAN